MSKDWVLVRLGDFLSELPKSTLPASCSEANGAYAFYCSSSEPKAADTWLQEHPAILMGTGGVASVHLGKGRYAYSTDTWAIRIKESSKLTQPYAYRVLELSLPKIDYAGFEGSGLRHLRKSYIKDFRFLAPSDSAPQKQIVSILTGIDTAIENTEALIAKYQQIKAGLMHDLFTRGVLPNGQLRPPREQAPELYQETAIGWIPRDWECQRLGLILSKSGGYLQTGPFGSQLHAAEYKDEGVPVVMPQDINDGSIQTTSIARISEARAASLARHRLKVGDIIIARRGELSRAAAVGHAEVEWICGTGCFLLRLGRTELNHFFFSHVYRHDFVQRQVAGMQVGSTMPSLNNDVMSRLFFPFPSSAEQGEITQRLDLAEQKISALQDELSKLKQQKQGLMHDLLTGKVPVTIENRTTTTEAVV
ncbi:MAG: restriction endonuclease subunit S [Burkholderiales bacterium]|nr:restriction endonuclease subunit S [Burkholderiales bacterium]MCA3155318.1 restriction endonuclease subunit S [Burkholderiales bacterium]MCA3157671.1 restriction endonuclease subunit S [Burkholderiales bacterium]